jgi:RimJ/RimL family protein N-acetyltransferase
MRPPPISAKRLILDALCEQDAPKVEELAGDAEVAAGVVGIPHPYPRGTAVGWIEALNQDDRAEITWAIRIGAERIFVGCVTLFLVQRHSRAEIAFWVGRPYWRHGFATEAAFAVVRYAFDRLALHRIDGGHFSWNEASGAVLAKLGFQREGVRPGFFLRSGRFEDVVVYGLVRSGPSPERCGHPERSGAVDTILDEQAPASPEVLQGRPE